MPDCTIIPVLQYRDVVNAVNYFLDTFNFKIRWQAGDHRAQLIYGNGVFVVTELKDRMALSIENEKIKIATHSVLVSVKDINTHFENAKLKGAEILESLTDYFYGERQYSITDIGGHRWTFSETIKEMLPEEWGATSFNAAYSQ